MPRMRSMSTIEKRGSVVLVTPRKRKNKQCAPSTLWCFTIGDDNLKMSAISSDIQSLMDPVCKEYVFQLEKPDNPDRKDDPDYVPFIHWQGCLKFKKKQRPMSVFPKDWKTHWEKTRSHKHSIGYCSNPEKRLDVADGNLFIHGVTIPRPLVKMTYEKLYGWQKMIADKFSCYAGEFCRVLHWYWEVKGKIGKSVMTKFFVDQRKALMVSGKGNDIRYAVQKYVVDKGEGPELAIMDIPRDSLGYVSYTALENVKDACFFSGKYEGGMVRYNTPHVIVFANKPPEIGRMSLDRWIIHDLNELRRVLYAAKAEGKDPTVTHSLIAGRFASQTCRRFDCE